jgi:iron complex outermembrane receptor protein
VQDTPFSIAAPSEETLRIRGVTDIEGVAQNVAGFSVQNLGPGQSQVAMRGVSSGQIARDQPGVKEQVGAYLDDSPISLSLFTPDLDLFDVSRVEVLKGPQSTLYGKNTLVGALNIITTDPKFNFGGYAEAGYGRGSHGNENLWHIEGAVDVPVADKAAIRLTAAHQKRDGYVTAPGTKFRGLGYDTDYFRAKLLAELTDDLTWRASASYRDDNSPRMDVLTNDPGTVIAFQQQPGTGVQTFGPTVWDSRADFQGFSKNKSWLFINQLDYETSVGTLTSLTSYQISKSDTITDDGSAQRIITIRLLDNNKAFSQEFRLAGSGGGFTWLLGAYYLRDRQQDYVQTVEFQEDSSLRRTLNGARRVITFPTSGNTYAAFGQVGYDFTESFNLTGGLRYASDKRYGFTDVRIYTTTGAEFPTNFGPVNRSKTFKALTGNIVASLKLAPDVLTYASFSTGNKQGGYTPGSTPAAAIIPYKEVMVDAYEVGIKSRPFRGSTLNVAGFYNKFKNLQVQQTLPGTPPLTITTNAAGARAYGADVELAVDLLPTLRFDALYTYLHSEIQDYIVQSAPLVVLDGVPTTRSPKHSGRAGLTYHDTLFGNGFELNGNLQFKSKFTNDLVATGNLPSQRFLAPTPGFHTWNASLSYDIGTFRISAYIRNITNKQYYLAKVIQSPAAYYSAVPGEPRTFELSVRKTF